MRYTNRRLLYFTLLYLAVFTRSAVTPPKVNSTDSDEIWSILVVV